ncbi:MAG: hypothetical protein IJY06_00100 [Oscillospiraceae bacterium]|nr:hypothetical protein [Oscillospiraceae bacterium]
MRRVSEYVKMSLAVLMVLATTIFCAMRLLKVQVVESESYNRKEAVITQYSQKIESTRGEIVDAQGTTIISNHVSYAAAIDEKNFPSSNREGNAVILQLLEILLEEGVEWTDTLPITDAAPYEFDPESSASEITAMKKSIGVNDYATAQNCIDVLIKDYEISAEYTPQQQRMIAGIRYTMLDHDFSMSNRFKVAESLPMKLVSRLSEMSCRLSGVTVVQQAERVVEVGDVIPHEIGTVGPIFAENADEYLALGYDLDATVGISGIEKAMETELQGRDGVRTITFQDGAAVSDEITKEMVAGNTVMLTVNGEFQRGLQTILEDFIANFHNINEKPELSGNDVTSGAIVVLDAKTGAILGEATCPTYDLTEYSELYDELLHAKANPLFNRATQGLYRPGSTFKTITATAGLNEGVINGGTSYLCQRDYYFIDTPYQCTGYHNYISVAPALKVSCNAFFYDLSRNLTIDRIAEYASYYGIGQNTGIETRDSAGYMATPEKYHELGMQWTVGQVLQAGIGNGETMVTPLQLAVVANTIANEGVRYEPYLVDSIWDYNMEECLDKTEPTIAETIELNYGYVYSYIEEGMIAASTNNMPAKYSLANLGYPVAIKTGTPQQDSREQDSVFIGYAPANDPQIAFAGIIEGGEYSKYMIRDILKLYEEIYGMH